MQAITLESFGGPEHMQLSDVPMPEFTDDQVLIRVANSSVNRPDIVQRQGNYPPPPGDSDILGLEVAGVVDAVVSPYFPRKLKSCCWKQQRTRGWPMLSSMLKVWATSVLSIVSVVFLMRSSSY